MQLAMTRATLKLPTKPAPPEASPPPVASPPLPVKRARVQREPVKRPPRAEPAANPPEPVVRKRAERVAPPIPEPADDLPRLSKVMSERGLCSRREADEWIEQGWVSVNDKIVTVLGARVAADARIDINPEASKHLSERVTILLHKAAGAEALTEKGGRVIARTVVNATTQWEDDSSTTSFQRGHLNRIVYTTPLDPMASGLVVFTQDDRVAKRLMANEAEEEFIVQVEGEMSAGAAKRLEHGLMLNGVKLPPGHASWQSEGKLRLVLRGSRSGLVQNVCTALGLKVNEIRRIRIGSVPMAKLPVGQWRFLQRGERL
jgi:23S rRNA pseudouridine2604 synthase